MSNKSGIVLNGLLRFSAVHKAPFQLTFVRHASRPTLHTAQKRKLPGVKRLDGDYVRQGDLLVTQIGLHFHPGLNVDVGVKNTLYSMVDGRVVITCEKVDPNELEHTKKYYPNVNRPIYKRYFHVISFKQSIKFNLVELV